MATKITVTITQDKENGGSDKAMADTIALLTALGITPTRKVALTIECEDEDADHFRDELSVVLSGRPVGIEAVIKRTTEENVSRARMQKVTPMDKAGWN